MKRLSISKILYFRKRIKTFTLIALMILLVSLTRAVILKNPQKSAATVLTFNSGTNNVINTTDALSGYDEVFIDNVTVTMSTAIGGSHTIRKLTIKGPSAILTHEALLTTDFTGVNINDSGRVKRVDIIADEVDLLNGGSIDVSAKGYPGGVATVVSDAECLAYWGYPTYATADSITPYGENPGLATPAVPGGGEGSIAGDDIIRYSGGAGGGHGGKGGYSYRGGYGSGQFQLVRGGDVMTDSDAEPVLWGAGGGGGCSLNGGNVAVGGTHGGGAVKIRTNTIRFDSSSSGIYAIGENGQQNASNHDAAGGAGAGGSIWLADKSGGNNLVVAGLATASPGSPNVAPGTNLGLGGVAGAEDGTANQYLPIGGNNGWWNLFGSHFSAKGGASIADGGSAGGAGGGGKIAIHGTFTRSCYISQSDPNYIPSWCENADVVLDGARTSGIVAPVLADYDENGLRTASATRYFNSLTVKVGAILTHSAISVGDMAADTDRDGSLVNNPISAGYHRRVGLNVATFVKLESGGQIDATGKGYPGGSTVGHDGYGPSGGKYATLVGVWDQIGAGGGGHYGGGGTGATREVGGTAYPIAGTNVGPGSDSPNGPLEWGSGGGYAHRQGSGENTRAQAGYAGGGYINIVADQISMTTDSRIKANGQAGSGNCGGDAYKACGGMGAAGSIWLTVRTFSDELTGIPTYNGGDGCNGNSSECDGGVGSLVSDFPVGSNIEANGSGWALGGGGGGGIILISGGSANNKIRKHLTAVRRGDCTGGTCFNPYELIEGDEIQVTINIEPSNYTGRVYIGDYYLMTTGDNNQKTVCRPTGRDYFKSETRIPDPAVNDISGWLRWDYQAVSGEEVTVSYNCIVTEIK